MSTVYDGDVTVTMRGVADTVGLPHTVNPVEHAGTDVLVEIKEGPAGAPGPQGATAWPWQWQGDATDFATLQALGLGTGDARKAWRVVAEEAIYLWTGMEWIRFVDAFDTTGHQGTPNTLTGVATQLAAGSSATAAITGTPPNQVLEIGFPRGETGDQGDPGEVGAIVDAQDVGDLAGARSGDVLAWSTADELWHPIPSPRLGGPWAIAGSQFSGGSNMSAAPKVLATMTIPAQPIAWRPIVVGGQINGRCHVSGALDESRVDVEVLLGSVDGPRIGYAGGSGASNNHMLQFAPWFDYPVSPESTLGVVAANTTAILYVRAIRFGLARNYTITTSGAQLIIAAQPVRPQP